MVQIKGKACCFRNCLGVVLNALAPGQLLRDEKEVSNFKAKSLINARMDSQPNMSCDAADDILCSKCLFYF